MPAHNNEIESHPFLPETPPQTETTTEVVKKKGVVNTTTTTTTTATGIFPGGPGKPGMMRSNMKLLEARKRRTKILNKEIWEEKEKEGVCVFQRIAKLLARALGYHTHSGPTAPHARNTCVFVRTHTYKTLLSALERLRRRTRRPFLSSLC